MAAIYLPVGSGTTTTITSSSAVMDATTCAKVLLLLLLLPMLLLLLVPLICFNMATILTRLPRADRAVARRCAVRNAGRARASQTPRKCTRTPHGGAVAQGVDRTGARGRHTRPTNTPINARRGENGGS